MYLQFRWISNSDWIPYIRETCAYRKINDRTFLLGMKQHPAQLLFVVAGVFHRNLAFSVCTFWGGWVCMNFHLDRVSDAPGYILYIIYIPQRWQCYDAIYILVWRTYALSRHLPCGCLWWQENKGIFARLTRYALQLWCAGTTTVVK